MRPQRIPDGRYARKVFLSSVIAYVASQLAPGQPMSLLFCRHAETVANATGKYNSATIDVFSAKGAAQIAKLTDRLWRTKIDVVIVSPSPRALRTIAPYLRRAKRTAEIWPELYECCDNNTRKIKGLTSAQVRFGARVPIPEDLKGLFTFRYGKDGKPVDRYIVSTSYDDGLRQVRVAADAIKTRFFRTGHSVLVVGHSLHGGRLLELMQGKPMLGKLRPENATPMLYFERPDRLIVPGPQFR